MRRQVAERSGWPVSPLPRVIPLTSYLLRIPDWVRGSSHLTTQIAAPVVVTPWRLLMKVLLLAGMALTVATAIVVAVATAIVVAQVRDPFTGTWTLNVA